LVQPILIALLEVDIGWKCVGPDFARPLTPIVKTGHYRVKPGHATCAEAAREDGRLARGNKRARQGLRQFNRSLFQG
jgi:hypothetical protein